MIYCTIREIFWEYNVFERRCNNYAIFFDFMMCIFLDILLYKNKFELDFLPIQADGGLEISKSLSQMENHPQFSGMTPGIPLVQLHPKPWCTATSTIHREHLGRGTARTNPVHGYSEQDKSSDHSGDGSLTDSGKGPSEEGEMKHRLPHSLGGHYGTHGHGTWTSNWPVQC